MTLLKLITFNKFKGTYVVMVFFCPVIVVMDIINYISCKIYFIGEPVSYTHLDVYKRQINDCTVVHVKYAKHMSGIVVCVLNISDQIKKLSEIDNSEIVDTNWNENLSVTYNLAFKTYVYL